jgi:hypothetical protein
MMKKQGDKEKGRNIEKKRKWRNMNEKGSECKEQ